MGGNSFSGELGEGGDFLAAFQALTFGGGTYTPKKLPAAKAAPDIPDRSGASAPIATPGRSGGGIASPLTETAYADRTWWDSRVTATPDGLFTLAWTPLKSIKMQDAGSEEVVLNFKDAP